MASGGDGEDPTLEDVLDEVRDLRDRVAALEEAVGVESPGEAPAAAGEAAADDETFRVVDAEGETAQPETPDEPTPEGGEPEGTPSPTKPASGGSTGRSAVGSDVLGKAGVLVLTLGLAFFVAYAIETGLIGLRTRIVLGVLAGLGVAAIGHRLRDHPAYGRLAQVGAGGGFGLAYFSLFAAYHFEAYRPLFGLTLATDTILLGALAAGVAGYAARTRSSGFLVEALVLGFATSFLAAELTLLSLAYTSLLALGVSAASVRVGTPGVAVAGLAGAYLHLVFVGFVHDAPAQVMTFAALDGIGFAGFAAGVPDDPALETATDVSGRAQLVTANAVGLLSAGTLVAEEGGVLDAGTWPLLVGLAHGGLAAVASSIDRDELVGPALLAGVAGVALAVPLALDGSAFVLAWTALYVVVALARLAAASEGLRNAVHAMALLLAGAALFTAGDLAAGGERVVTLAAASAALATGYGVFAVRDERARPGDSAEASPGLLHLGAAVLVLVVLLALELSSFTFTVALGVLGGALVLAGLSTDWVEPRWTGLLVFGLALAKAFLYDVWELDLALRVVAFVGLGLALVAAAVAYARYEAGGTG